MNGKGRPEKLTDELKQRITLIQKDRKKKLKAPVIQEEIRLYLEKQVKREVEANNLPLDTQALKDTIEERLPGISSIQKYLKENEDREKQTSPLDKLWHLGLMSKENYLEYAWLDFTAEAIEAIIEVEKWAEKEGISQVGTHVRFGITVRQALWISRLYRVVRKYIGKSAEDLWRASYTYTALEANCRISGTDFNTWKFDRALRLGDAEYRGMIRKGFDFDDENVSTVFFNLEMASEPIMKQKEGEK